MRAFLTGGTGFTGQHLRRLLEDEGVDVTVAVRPAGFEDPSALAQQLSRVKPDYVFHLAGLAAGRSLNDYYLANVQYASLLLTAMELAGFAWVPTLFVGTAAEYGPVDENSLPISEDTPEEPVSIYGASKLAQTILARQAVRESERRILVVRPFNIIGPGMPEHIAAKSFARQIMASASEEKSASIDVGNLTPTRDFIDVRDAVRVYWQLLRTPDAHGQVINVCSGKEVAVHYLLERMIALSGRAIEVRTDASRVRRLDFPRNVGDPSRLVDLLGPIELRSLESTLRDILDHEASAS